MRDPPRHVQWAHGVFNGAVVVAALYGLVYIWAPFENEVAQKLLWSDLVLLAGSMLVLAAHRTVFWRARGEVLDPR
jgi:hypothetical protein